MNKIKLNKIIFNAVRFTADALGTINNWLFIHLPISVSKSVCKIFFHLHNSSVSNPKEKDVKESTLLPISDFPQLFTKNCNKHEIFLCSE
jgi:hypothetical protein